MTPLTLAQIENAVIKLTEITFLLYGDFVPLCEGEFHKAHCENCNTYQECLRSSELETLARELIEIVEEKDTTFEIESAPDPDNTGSRPWGACFRHPGTIAQRTTAQRKGPESQSPTARSLPASPT